MKIAFRSSTEKPPAPASGSSRKDKLLQVDNMAGTSPRKDLIHSSTTKKDLFMDGSKAGSYVLVDKTRDDQITSAMTVAAATATIDEESSQQRTVASIPGRQPMGTTNGTKTSVINADDGKTEEWRKNHNSACRVEVDDEANSKFASASCCPSTGVLPSPTLITTATAMMELSVANQEQEHHHQPEQQHRSLLASRKGADKRVTMENSTTATAATSSNSETVVALVEEAAEKEAEVTEAENDDTDNDVDSNGSSQLPASTMMDALVAAATAEIDALEPSTTMSATEGSEASNNGKSNEQIVDHGNTEVKNLQQQEQQNTRQKAVREEEKKDTTTTEDSMESSHPESKPNPLSDLPETEATVTEEAVDIVEESEESLEPEMVNEKINAVVVDTNDYHSASLTTPTQDDDCNNNSSGNATKIPVDASGICSLEREKGSEDSHDPPETIVEEAPREMVTDGIINLANGSAAVSNENLEATMATIVQVASTDSTVEGMPIQTPKITNTRKAVGAAPQSLELVEESQENGDALSTQPYTANGDVALNAQMQRDLLLANKDKEGFALLARAESVNAIQQQQQPSLQEQQEYSQENVYVNQNGRANQLDPDAEHRRGDSSVASAAAPVASFPHDSESRLLDENSGRPIDDWRPSQVVSYPASPQGLTQTISFANGGYMMVPPPRNHNQAPAPHAFMPQPPAMLHHQSSFHSHQSQQIIGQSFGYQTMPGMAPIPPSPLPASTGGGKRKIRLRLQEEILARPSHERRKSFFFGRSSTKNLLRRERTTSEGESESEVNEIDRGAITVSWFEGTSSLELQEHVTRSVSRKLKLQSCQTLDDIRILDTKSDPPEEIVLCPYIPSGSEFLLRYKIKSEKESASPAFFGPPDSPSAAPSPFPSHGNLGSLDASQLALLRKQLDAVQEGESRGNKYKNRARANRISPVKLHSDLLGSRENSDGAKDDALKETRSRAGSDNSDNDNESETNTLQPENSVDAKLRQITELLLMDKEKAQQQQQQRHPQVEKRDVIFVIANYFVLFVAFITISAEMQARAPQWLSWMETQLKNVHNCSQDQDALFECVSNGEFAGLFASVILWLSRSVLARQFFLLGFDSPQKLWTVFYESLVGAFCWGVSYMFIRRGMNPDTRPQFLQRYWKDAMYGSLAGFNATFMKQILKNLIPQEAVEEAFNDRQLKILSWLPTFS